MPLTLDLSPVERDEGQRTFDAPMDRIEVQLGRVVARFPDGSQREARAGQEIDASNRKAPVILTPLERPTRVKIHYEHEAKS